MKEKARRALKRSRLYLLFRNKLFQLSQARDLREWEKGRREAPPPHSVKQHILREYSRKFGLKILVETGTFHGDMIDALKHEFQHLYSIELSRELFERAEKRFKKDLHVELINGDSSVELGRIVRRLDQPALFWLDGHYSGGDTGRGSKDTPILEELGQIFGSDVRPHVVIIDDARFFGADPSYPSLESLIAFVRSNRPRARIEIQDDSIRITPE